MHSDGKFLTRIVHAIRQPAQANDFVQCGAAAHAGDAPDDLEANSPLKPTRSSRAGAPATIACRACIYGKAALLRSTPSVTFASTSRAKGPVRFMAARSSVASKRCTFSIQPLCK